MRQEKKSKKGNTVPENCGEITTIPERQRGEMLGLK